MALAAWLPKGLGVPAGKTAALLGQLGIQVTPGGVVQALPRAARRAQPTNQALAAGVRASPEVAPDQTGWRVGGGKAWRWAFVGEGITVSRIAHGCGDADAAAVLGEGSAGTIERDGWAPDRRFAHATHQTCLAQLLRRCRELLSDAVAGQAKTPQRGAPPPGARAGAALRPRRRGPGGQPARRRGPGAGGRGGPTGGRASRSPPNRRLLNHLAGEPDHLFTLLRVPGVQATNWPAEQAIPPAVICRKARGSNRTWAGAATWQALTSVLRTASPQGRDPIELLARLLPAPAPILADLAIPGY